MIENDALLQDVLSEQCGHVLTFSTVSIFIKVRGLNYQLSLAMYIHLLVSI